VILPVCADIKQFTLSKSCYSQKALITTIMNPPFGVQQKAADRAFLETAFSFSHIVYSIHLSHKGVKNFISRFIKKFGWEIDYIFPYQMILEHTYSFHKKKRKSIEVDIYRFKKKG
jgi:putative methylase